jgi:uncharacterized membrane protein YhaH (DUF805 family)
MADQSIRLLKSIRCIHSPHKIKEISIMLKTYLQFWTKMFVGRAKTTPTQFWVPWIVNFAIAFCTTYLIKNITNSHELSLMFLFPKMNSVLTVLINGISLILIVIVCTAMFTSYLRRMNDAGISVLWGILPLAILPVKLAPIVLVLALLPSNKNAKHLVNQSETHKVFSK